MSVHGQWTSGPGDVLKSIKGIGFYCSDQTPLHYPVICNDLQYNWRSSKDTVGYANCGNLRDPLRCWKALKEHNICNGKHFLFLSKNRRGKQISTAENPSPKILDGWKFIGSVSLSEKDFLNSFPMCFSCKTYAKAKNTNKRRIVVFYCLIYALYLSAVLYSLIF